MQRKRWAVAVLMPCIIQGICMMQTVVLAQQAAGGGDKNVIRSESRLVLVDAVVTDKKGAYVHDLTAKDFRVWEDNKEQTIKSFAFQADPASPTNSQKHYMVLLFDNSTIGFGDQAHARQAAGQFLASNAGPNRPIAIANFGGSLAITQNFTEDAERLKKMVANLQFSNVASGDGGDAAGGFALSAGELGFGQRNLVMAIRSLAKALAAVPGRKTVVLLTGGFPLNPELISDLTATIDTCNRANVAIYPIDVRGLVAMNLDMQPAENTAARLLPAAFIPGVHATYPLLQLAYFDPQHTGGGGGGGAGGGGGHSGGGTGGGGGGGGRVGGGGGGTGGGGRTGGGGGGGGRTGGGGIGGGSGQPIFNSPLSRYNMARNLLPNLSNSVVANQELMYALANGTGGFVIANTNDLLSGLEKIGKEQNEYYLLGYTPEESDEGSCHTLKVKVEHGLNVRARTGYCNVRTAGVLAGNASEAALEERLKSDQGGTVTAALQAPFFYNAAGKARVTVALEVPADKIAFEKKKGKFQSELNVLGVAYTSDGKVAARFSDDVKLSFENKKEMEEFQQHPYHYENEFHIAPGQYLLKVAFSSGGNDFGKQEAKLLIEPYDGKQLALSGVAMSRELRPISENDIARDAALLEDRTPMVTQGLAITPTGSNRFAKTDKGFLFLEMYDPYLKESTAPTVGLQLKVVDAKTGEQKLDTGFMNMSKSVTAGNSVVPIGLRLPLDTLAPGDYRAEIRGADSAQHATSVRTIEFHVE